jgi:hypothetical protein
MANIKFAEMILEIITQFGGRFPGQALCSAPADSDIDQDSPVEPSIS